MEMRPGYKQTEVGAIPDDWNAVPMEAITTHIGDGLHGTPAYLSNGEFFFINGNNLQGGKIVVTSETRSVDHSEFIKHRKPLSHRSILMSINGTVGNLGLFDGEPVVLGKSAAYLNVKPDLSRQFVYYFLQTEIVRQQFLDGLTGSTIGNLGLATIRQTHIVLPPTEAEQRAIATSLSDVDALLGGLDRLIAKKRDLKQAAMQQLLTGQTRLPGFHGKWEVKRLGEAGTFLKGSGVKKDEANSGDLPCIRYGEIYTHYNDYIRSFNSWISSKVAATATRLRQGDLLFAGSGETKEEIGKCVAFVDDREAFAGGDIVILRLAGANPMFMGYYCNTAPINAQKASKGQGDAVVHISAAALSSVEVTLPPHDEQTAIAAVLSDMDAELAALESRRNKTHALKQAMMQELLTGKTRLVTPDNNEGKP
jgi:type I restriction enzyme, S subunit